MKRSMKKKQVMKQLVEGIESVDLHSQRKIYFNEYRKTKVKKPSFELVGDVVIELPAAVQISAKE